MELRSSPFIKINGECHLERDTVKKRLWVLPLSESHYY